MKRPTEKAFRELDAFLSKHQDEIQGEEDVNRLVEQFMAQQNAKPGITLPLTEDNAQTADDYLELAGDTDDPDEALSLVEQALQLEPENIDALCMQALICGGEEPNLTVSLLGEALQKATPILEREGWFDDENIGAFWGLWETRPYMRLLHRYFLVLADCGRLRLAIREGEEMLRLCENDNLGVRYPLMCLYAELEEREGMLSLHSRYEEIDDPQLLLPLSIGFYRLGELDKAEDYLVRITRITPDVRRLIDAVLKGKLDTLISEDDEYFEYGSVEALASTLLNNPRLFIGMESWFFWAKEKLPALKRGRKPAKYHKG